MTYLDFQSDRGLATGLVNPITDGLLSINAGDPTKFDVTAGEGQFIDSFTDPKNPTVGFIPFPSFTAVPVDNLATATASFIYLNSSPAIVQTTTLQGDDFLRDNIALGIITHTQNIAIETISSPTQVSLSSLLMGLSDLSTAGGPINSAQGDRNILSGNSGSLGLDKTDGSYYFHAINARNSNKIPSTIFSPALTKPVMFVAWRSSGSPDGIGVLITNTIPAGVYDDGTATSADALPQGVLGDDEWTNHRVFELANQNFFTVVVGQEKYSSKFAALHGSQSEVFDVFDVLKGTAPKGTVTMRGGATDLTDLCDAGIRQEIPARADFR